MRPSKEPEIEDGGQLEPSSNAELVPRFDGAVQISTEGFQLNGKLGGPASLAPLALATVGVGLDVVAWTAAGAPAGIGVGFLVIVTHYMHLRLGRRPN